MAQIRAACRSCCARHAIRYDTTHYSPPALAPRRPLSHANAPHLAHAPSLPPLPFPSLTPAPYTTLLYSLRFALLMMVRAVTCNLLRISDTLFFLSLNRRYALFAFAASHMLATYRILMREYHIYFPNFIEYHIL